MKLSQKKTCFGCKALGSKHENPPCRLGYETGTMKGCPNEVLPVEPCPKPMTKDDIYIANVELRKGAILGNWLKKETTCQVDKDSLKYVLKQSLWGKANEDFDSMGARLDNIRDRLVDILFPEWNHEEPMPKELEKMWKQ